MKPEGAEWRKIGEMNILITNSQEVQAYVILCALRSTAKRIVITEGGNSVVSPSTKGMASFSRFVDARYEVPKFADDWLAGRHQSENTLGEEAYVRRIEYICRTEKIDVIFPSLDPEVYVFAKNKKRFSNRGILTVVPDPEVIAIPMDKALTVLAAQRAGFPCPKTWFPESTADLMRVIRDSERPWIVKPRFTAHGVDMVFVDQPEELQSAFEKVHASHASPIVQEFIEGGIRQNYYVTVDRDGAILSLLAPKVVRTFHQGFRVRSKTCISASTAPHLTELRNLLHQLGLWGGYTVQTHIDPRDGIPKLLEINARLGQHLWWRTGLGVNEPMILIDLARGRQATGKFEFSDGVIMLDPYHDVFFLYTNLIEATFRVARRIASQIRHAAPAADIETRSVRIIDILRLYRRDYLNGKPKLLCPEVANLFVDPWPCIRVFWRKFWGITRTQLGRACGSLWYRIRRRRVEVSSPS